MIIKATMVAIGLALTILELQVQQPDGVVLMIAGVLFGMGLHWYKRSWSWRTFAVGALVAMGNPVAVGAITRGEPLLALVGFVLFGIAGRIGRK